MLDVLRRLIDTVRVIEMKKVAEGVKVSSVCDLSNTVLRLYGCDTSGTFLDLCKYCV